MSHQETGIPASPRSWAPLLVTGGTSPVGEGVVERLVARGDRVRLLVWEAQNPHPEHLPREGVEIVRGDLRLPWTFWEALEGCRALVHLAHIGFGGACVRACRAVGVQRLVALSSTRLSTRWPCETSRAVARGESSIARSGLDWTVLRSTMIYGARHDNNLSRLIRWIQRHRWVPLVEGGKSLIQPVSSEDLADLIVRVIDDPRTVRRRYLVAGPEAVSYRRLMEILAQELGRRVWFVSVPGSVAVAAAGVIERLAPRWRIRREQVRRLLEDKAFDIGEARTLLEFRPRSIEQGLRERLAVRSSEAGPP